MYKLAALAYKAKVGDGHIVDDAINMWTALFNMPLSLKKSEWKEWIHGSYSHIELWISDENGEFTQPVDANYWTLKFVKAGVAMPLKYLGKCYTSTMRDGMAGTVLRPASEVLKHPEQWDVGVVCEITDQEYNTLMFWINLAVVENKGYDKLCIADFFNPIRWWLPLHDKAKQICSEAFQQALLIVERYISKHVCSPRRIVRILKKRGVVFTPVTEM